jgi:hypothetical protein
MKSESSAGLSLPNNSLQWRTIMKGWRAPILDQIRTLQKSTENFYIELDNGRIIQVYEPASVATSEDCLGILSNRSGFEIIAAEHIVAVAS